MQVSETKIVFIFVDYGWIITVNMISIRGPDPGTSPADQGGHCAAHMGAPDPTRMQHKQGSTGYKQPSIYKPCLLQQLAGGGQIECNRPPHSP